MPPLAEVSVVVPVYNQAAMLPVTLPSLLALEDAKEIILVDDGSTDGSPALLADAARQRATVQVITHESNRGRSAARNSGIGAASGEIILFLDADIVPEPDAPRAHAARYADPEVMGVLSNDRPDELDPQDPFHRYILAHTGPRQRGGEGALDFKYFITGYSSVRRPVFDEVGRFDEAITYGEDLEFAFRLDQRFPASLRLAPDAIVHQRGIGNLRVRADRLRAFGRNLPHLFEKHPRLADRADLAFVASAALRPFLSQPAASASRAILPLAPRALQIPLIRHILASAVASGYRETIHS